MPFGGKLPRSVGIVAFAYAQLLPFSFAGEQTVAPLAEGAIFRPAEEHVRIDGNLIERSWSSAQPISRTFEIYPANVGDPPVRTEVRFLYDDKNIYIGVRAYDPSPSSVRTYRVR